MSRRRTRELALQVMFEVDVGRQVLGPALERAQAQLSEGEGAWLRAFCEGAWTARAEIDAVLAPLMRGWPLERLANTDRTVLRLAAYELLRTDTPPQIVISEAVTLAKRYGTEESGRFVNGVLGALARGRSPGAPVADEG